MFLSLRRASLLTALALAALVFSGPGATRTSATPPPKQTRFFDMVYCWGADSIDDIDIWCPCAELTLHSNGRFDAFDCMTGTSESDVGDWWTKKGGKTITFELDNGTLYTGTLQADGSYFGTMTGYLGNTGVWQGRFTP